MRRALIVAALALCTPAWGATVSAGSFNLRSAPDVLGCADVRAFGAKGDGVTDDTAAIQAAIDSFGANGGAVCAPAATYKITGTVNFRIRTKLYGAGRENTIFDATSVTTTVAFQGASSGHSPEWHGFTLNLVPDTSAPTNVAGFDIGNQTIAAVLSDVLVNGGFWGLSINGVNTATLINVGAGAAKNQPCRVSSSSFVTFINSICGNGTSGYAAYASNLFIQLSSDITWVGGLVDEIFNGGDGILILDSDRITFYGPKVYNSNGGRTIRIGNGSQTSPRTVTLDSVHVDDFYSGVPVNTIEIRGTGHVLRNVTTKPKGGGDILLVSTDATYENVNGVFMYAGLRRTYPGSGSNQLWIDPTDALSTTYLRFAR